MAFFEIKGNSIQQDATSTNLLDEDQQKLNELLGQIDSVEQTIGHKYVASHINDETIDDEFAEEIARVKEIYIEKEKLEVKLLALSGKRMCTECGSVIELASKFCNSCGAKQDDMDIKNAIGGTLCPNCGSIVGGDSLFCTSCGTKLS